VQAVSSYAGVMSGEASIEDEIGKLKKIFSRGDYNYGNYLYGNDGIIETTVGNHRGIKIGRVEKFSPFKDLYKVEISSNKKLNSGDGLKIIDGYNEMSLGVGNVENEKDGLQVIYTKHKPFKGDVYLAVDSEYENMIVGKDKKIPLEIFIEAKENKPLKVETKCGNICCVTESDFVCDGARNQPVGKDDFLEIFGRIKDTEFYLKDIKFDIGNVFIPKSSITKIKNLVILNIENAILNNVNKHKQKVIKYGECDNNYDSYDNLGNFNVDFIYCKTPLKMDNFCKIFSPEIYNMKEIDNFIKKNNGEFVYLNLPIFATGREVKIIDSILNKFKSKIGIVVNNYWHLKYVSDFKFIVGYNMNILNNFSVNFYMHLGADNYMRSIENYLASGLRGGLAYEGYPTVMTLCHCPFKVSCNSSCDKCKYSDNLMYKLNDGKEFFVRRYKIINCYFELVLNKKLESKSRFKIIDMR